MHAAFSQASDVPASADGYVPRAAAVRHLRWIGAMKAWLAFLGRVVRRRERTIAGWDEKLMP